MRLHLIFFGQRNQQLTRVGLGVPAFMLTNKGQRRMSYPSVAGSERRTGGERSPWRTSHDRDLVATPTALITIGAADSS
jgi:hypothetical protein